ncbi:MAG: hypothetical protein ABI417_19635 [Coleofasciculaceae cyanobacterium]
MNYPIPANPQEIVALHQKPIDEELVAAAIAGVIQIARQAGQSLDDLTAEVLAEDSLLDQAQRRWLSDLVAQAWKSLPPITRS